MSADDKDQPVALKTMFYMATDECFVQESLFSQKPIELELESEYAVQIGKVKIEEELIPNFVDEIFGYEAYISKEKWL